VRAAELVDVLDGRLRPLEIAANRAWWDANVDASETTEQQRAAADLAVSDLLADSDAYAEVRDAQTSRDAEADRLVARALAVLAQAFVPHQVPSDLRRRLIELQTAIESRFAQHRSTIDGEAVDDNAILEVLRHSNDAGHRRAAWEASKTVGAVVASDLRELVRLRNEAARELGFRDHFALVLATTDFDENRLFATLDAVDAITREPFRVMKAELDARLAERFGVAAADLRPWHYDDPFFQDAPKDAGVDLDPVLQSADLEALTIRTFDGMGIEVRDVAARSDLTPRERKVQHAFCIDVDRDGDVRVLSNNVPGARWTETMLHEFGHAAYFEGVGRDLPWLLRTMHLCLTEGVAMRCGRLVNEPEWLTAIAQLPGTTIDELAPRLRAARRAALLVFARWVLVMTNFERALYADPDGAHDSRWWDLVERFQLVRRPDDRTAPDWAAKIHLCVAPVYYHNYLFGELIASQLEEAFGSLVDRVDTGARLGELLFAPGASLRWDHLVEHATGAPLSPAVLERSLRG
jgi:peptidyl-dipeptidase A